VAVLVCGCVAVSRTADEEKQMFADFMQTYGRTYTPAEKVTRFNCFVGNLKLIDQRNARDTAIHGINQFTDLCPAEFAKFYLGARPSNSTRQMAATNVAVAACSNVDWRMKGAVTGIKNQGQCGSCWSFSATGNMEGQWMLAGHSLVSVSEEELVQCSHNGNQGCNGGWMDDAFSWVNTNGGIDSEEDYPYTSGGGITGNCINSKLANKVAHFTSYKDITQTEAAMAAQVCSSGPLSIAVDAITWSSYTGGIMTDCTGTQLDHGVLIVGFDDNNSPPYWIVKNSWGTSWGEAGYIRLGKGTDQCGLTQAPSTIIA